MKKALIIAGGVVAVLIAAALIVPGFLNWNEYKLQIENAVEAATGRDVRIGGDVSLAVLPAPAFSVQKLALSNLPGGQNPEMMELEALDVRIRLFPLIRGQLDVDKIVLVSPRINLEVLPDGRANWDFASGEETAAEGSKGGMLSTVRVNRFVIEDGVVVYRDAVSGTEERVDALNAVISAESLAGPFKVQGDMVARATPFAFALAAGRTGNGKIPVSLDLMLSGASADIAYRGLVDPAVPRSAEGTFRLKGANIGALIDTVARVSGGEPSGLGIRKPVLFEAAFVASETGFRTTALNLELASSRGDGRISASWEGAPQFGVDLSFGTLDVDELLPKTAPSATAPADADGPIELPDPAMLLPGAATGQVKVAAEAVRFKGRAMRQVRLAARAEDGRLLVEDVRALLPGGGDVKLAGAVTQTEAGGRFDGTADISANNLRDILAWLGTEPEGIPAGRLSNFALQGKLFLSPAEAGIADTLVRLDTANFKGSAAFAPGSVSRVRLAGNLDRLDLGAYLPKGAKCLPEEESEATEDPFARFNAELDLKIGRLTCPETRADDLAINATLKAGELTIRDFSAGQLAGLKVASSGQIRNFWTDPAYDLTINAGGGTLVEVERLFPDLLARPAAQLGTASFSGKVQGSATALSSSGTLGLGGTTLAGSADLALKPEPAAEENPIERVGARFDLKAASLAQFIEQWDLPLTPPASRDDRPLALKGTIKGTPADLAVDLTGAIADANLKVKGRAQGLDDAMTYDLAVDVDGRDLRTTLRGLGLAFEPSDRTLGPLKLKATLTGGAQSLAVKIPSGQAGPMVFNGTTTVAFSDERPMIAGDVRAGNVPLDRFLAAAPDEAAKEKTKHEWSREPFRNEWLDTFNANFRVRADAVTLNGYRFEQPNFTLAVTDGILEVRDLTGKLFEGDVALDMRYGGKGVSDLVLDMSLKGASVQQAIKTAFNLAPLTGTIGFDSRIRAKGASPYDLVRGLNGATQVTLGEGLVRGIDLPKISANMKAMDSVKGFGQVLGAALGGGSTAHKGFDTTVTTRDGTFALSGLVVELAAAKGLLNGTVDLVDWQVNSSGRLQLTEHPGAPPIGVDIAGLLNGPTVNYQTQEIKSYMAAEISRAMLKKATGGGIDQLLGIPKPPESEGGASEAGAPEGDAPAQTEPAPQQPRDQKPAERKPGRDLFKGILEQLNRKDQHKAE